MSYFRVRWDVLIHMIISVLQFTDMCQSLCGTAFTYSYKVQRLQKYSGIHVRSLIKRAVKAPIESIQRSIKLFINYSSPYSFPSLLNLLTFCAASLSPTGYSSAGASDFWNHSHFLDLDFNPCLGEYHKTHILVIVPLSITVVSNTLLLLYVLWGKKNKIIAFYCLITAWFKYQFTSFQNRTDHFMKHFSHFTFVLKMPSKWWASTWTGVFLIHPRPLDPHEVRSTPQLKPRRWKYRGLKICLWRSISIISILTS